MIGLSSAAVLLLGCSVFCRTMGLTWSRAFFHRVFGSLSVKKEVDHFLSLFFDVCIVYAQTAKSKKLGERDAVFGTGVVR